jgi:hypothetical protein
MRKYRKRVPAKLAEARRLGYAAWRKADEAARLAIPPAPPDPLPGDELQRWTFAGPGWAVVVSLQYISRRARSDQYRVVIDGLEWSACAGVSDALAHLRKSVLPRTATRRERDEYRPGPCLT